MHIILIEDNYRDRQLALDYLREAFPNADLRCFYCVGNFLTMSGLLPPDYVLVLEHHLPLLEHKADEEQTSAEYNLLVEKFPFVAEGWHHQEAGERVVRYVHSFQPNIKIIIYTDSNKENIAKDVISDQKVRYLAKESDNESRRLREAFESF